MPDKITLDRETFKVLAADTRIEILKRLERHKETLTDIAEGMGMAPSTIKEHLDKLVSVDLIEMGDKGTKWKYYRLTRKGRDLLNPYETKVWILLGTTMLFLFGSIYGLLKRLNSIVPSAPSKRDIASFIAKEAEEKALDMGTEAIPGFSIPYLEITSVIILALIVGTCVGYILRRKVV